MVAAILAHYPTPTEQDAVADLKAKIAEQKTEYMRQKKEQSGIVSDLHSMAESGEISRAEALTIIGTVMYIDV